MNWPFSGWSDRSRVVSVLVLLGSLVAILLPLLEWWKQKHQEYVYRIHGRERRL